MTEQRTDFIINFDSGARLTVKKGPVMDKHYVASVGEATKDGQKILEEFKGWLADPDQQELSAKIALTLEKPEHYSAFGRLLNETPFEEVSEMILKGPRVSTVFPNSDTVRAF